ncbi:putative Sarcosine oxidase, gamma subunit [Mesorhizobium plurifarium]|uniref:Putative Sarcosine oxidase, gamma subunit n=1 Tax=Mesorhizobium plurifarium TaxID=69974 RepID=A0A0K2VR48_MESPL|nr:putative Sarcosine oxidase, gamma subunit [Mesorhizobium plurifarium]
MAAGTATRVYPFMPGGAADGTRLISGAVVLSDLTDKPRFGLKGGGSAAWLAAQGIPLPAVNRIGEHRGMRVLRLGNEDILLLAEGAEATLAEVKNGWQAAPAPKGYSSWREEGWAWMRLSGARLAEAMSSLCALDLRPQKFADDDIAQTRVGHIEAVTFRSPTGFDILFDITASAYFARTVATVAGHTDQHRG